MSWKGRAPGYVDLLKANAGLRDDIEDVISSQRSGVKVSAAVGWAAAAALAVAAGMATAAEDCAMLRSSCVPA